MRNNTKDEKIRKSSGLGRLYGKTCDILPVQAYDEKKKPEVAEEERTLCQPEPAVSTVMCAG